MKKLPIALFVVSLSSSPSVLRAADGQEYHSERHGLTVTAPPGWRVVGEENAKGLIREAGGRGYRLICVFRDGKTPNSPTITLQWNVLDREPDLKEYAAMLRRNSEQLNKQHPQIEVLEPETVVTLGGKEFIRSAVAQRDKVVLFLHFARGKTGYTLGGNFAKDDYVKYKKICEEVAISLDWSTTAPPSGLDLATNQELLVLSDQYFSASQFDKSIKILETVLGREPPTQEKAEVLFRLSSAYLEKAIPEGAAQHDVGSYQKAEAYATQCLEVQPKHWLAMGNLATIMMNQGDLEEAGRTFDKAVKLADPAHPAYRQLMVHQEMVQGLLAARSGEEPAKKAPKKP